MNLFEWCETKIPKMKWYDISLIKLSSAAFALFLAKIWSPLLSLSWTTYLAIGILAALLPMKKFFSE